MPSNPRRRSTHRMAVISLCAGRCPVAPNFQGGKNMRITRISLPLLTALATLLVVGGLNCLYPEAGFPAVSQNSPSAARANRVADGGSPVPPVPPPPGLANGFRTPELMLVADGGSPVPPFSQLLYDGGSPVPPVPPPPGVAKGFRIPGLMLAADGGSPVPPVPPVPTGFAA